MRKKEEKNGSENVGQFHENIISKSIIKLLNKLIKEKDSSLSEIVLHFLNEPHIIKSVNLPASLPDAVMKIAKQELGVKSFSDFIRYLLIAYVLFHQTQINSEEEKVKEENLKPKCFIYACTKGAVGFLRSPNSGKIFPVCERHLQECLESGWLPVENNVGG
ncbi:MAG: hypothetical protein QXV37_01810 [Candidatus Jordarchaeaceae archaeon]